MSWLVSFAVDHSVLLHYVYLSPSYFEVVMVIFCAFLDCKKAEPAESWWLNGGLIYMPVGTLLTLGAMVAFPNLLFEWPFLEAL